MCSFKHKHAVQARYNAVRERKHKSPPLIGRLRAFSYFLDSRGPASFSAAVSLIACHRSERFDSKSFALIHSRPGMRHCTTEYATDEEIVTSIVLPFQIISDFGE
jgi:hypothetical protein